MTALLKTHHALALIAFLVVFLLPAHGAKKKPPAHPIDINAATIEELEQLPGSVPRLPPPSFNSAPAADASAASRNSTKCAPTSPRPSASQEAALTRTHS